jgi:hypothetical protein
MYKLINNGKPSMMISGTASLIFERFAGKNFTENNVEDLINNQCQQLKPQQLSL